MHKIGPIPIDDDVGKEVITRLTANMVMNSTFYTDSNGRDFLKRVIINIICPLSAVLVSNQTIVRYIIR